MKTLALRALGLVLALACVPSLAAHAPHSMPSVRVGIVLFDGVQIIDFAGPYEVFGQAGFGVTTLSHDGKPVTTAMGLRVTPDAAFDAAPAFDVLLVPGGDVEEAERDPAVLAFVRTHARSSRHVMSVCTGSFILAAAGALDGLRATTFTPRVDQMAARYPKVEVVRDVRWVDNGRIVTSAGLSSGLDAALHLVATLHGVDKARTAALRLEYDWKPEGGFVRSRMADRYLPKALESLVDWPKDMVARTDVSLGDERQWRTVHRLTTVLPAKELAARIERGMGRIEGWQREAGAPRWTRLEEGRRVALSIETTPDPAGDGVRLELRVETTPQ
ncbi:MAG: DJ-1/PfpI family protein [Lysobacteraceae bacterium]|nr:MAG: DJ-1/PfpI family protein [Xanthomonadaceae bacterium]